MYKSEQVNELMSALAKAQGKIKGALKDSANPFFKSKYADLASVVEAIREPFSENGLSYAQFTVPSEKDEVMVETVLGHASGQWMSGVTAIPVSKADAQGYGSALTYARRYGLAAAAGVAPEDDDGNAAAKAAPKVQQKPVPGVVEPDPKAVAALKACGSLDALTAVWQSYPEAQRNALVPVATACKKQIL